MGGDNDDDASMDHTSVDGELDSVDANASHQDDGANILAAIHLMRADFTVQLREVVSSNQEIKEAIGAFSERLTAAESRISKAEDDISALTVKEKSLQKKVQELTLKLEYMLCILNTCESILDVYNCSFDKRVRWVTYN